MQDTLNTCAVPQAIAAGTPLLEPSRSWNHHRRFIESEGERFPVQKLHVCKDKLGSLVQTLFEIQFTLTPPTPMNWLCI